MAFRISGAVERTPKHPSTRERRGKKKETSLFLLWDIRFAAFLVLAPIYEERKKGRGREREIRLEHGVSPEIECSARGEEIFHVCLDPRRSIQGPVVLGIINMRMVADRIWRY